MTHIFVLAAWVTLAIVAAAGLAGVVWYTIDHHAHLKTLSKTLQTISGRSQTTESTIQRIIGHLVKLAKRLEENEKFTSKVSSKLGQLKKNVDESDLVATQSMCDIMNEMYALAGALGYEVKTVDEGPRPVVTAIEKDTTSQPAVRAVK